jgi:hypothetical protein
MPVQAIPLHDEIEPSRRWCERGNTALEEGPDCTEQRSS